MDKHTKLVIEYILDHEFDDFMENPSTTHVYYNASMAIFGQEETNKLLDEAIQKALNE